VNHTDRQLIRFALITLIFWCGNPALVLAETQTSQQLSPPPATIESSLSADLHIGQRAFNAGDYAQAFTLWQNLAAQGHANAQIFIGLAYANGWGVGKSPKLARLWYRKAAEQGNASGQFLLGLELIGGQRVERATGVAWLRRAAELGDSSAQHFLDKARTRGWFKDVAKEAPTSHDHVATLALPSDDAD
jgi:hypothetical protein